MTDKKKKPLNRRLLTLLIAIPIGMFGFGYALVPIYNVMCSQLGINGKTSGAVDYDLTHAKIDKSRWVTVEFIASNNENLPWKFYPLTKSIKVHPGEVKKVAFFAENDSGRRMTVQAIPSVAPGQAAKYLMKTECFCFTQQTFDNGESQEMPLLFHLDPELPKNINELTLSYTMFDATGIKPQASSKSGRIS